MRTPAKTKQAIEMQIGDIIAVDGAVHSVTGWYIDGGGRMVLEYGNRWHPMSKYVTLEVLG